jgi:hypothetical protein
MVGAAEPLALALPPRGPTVDVFALMVDTPEFYVNTR